jgi:hypothetical protein
VRVFRFPAVVLLGAVLAAGSLASTGIARSASTTPTAFVNVTASPNYVTYGHTTITVTGRLVQSADHSAGVAGELVQIDAESAAETIGTDTTDPTGRFSVTADMPWQDALTAVTAGDATYAGATSAPVDVSIRPAPTRVTLNRQAQLVAPAGTVRTFTGKALVEVSGKWVPLVGAYVQVAQNDGLTLPPNGPTGTTGPDGTFSLQAEAVSSGGNWFANTTWTYPSPVTSQPVYAQVNSNFVAAYVSYRTRITKFHMPARSEAHNGLDFSGAMQFWDGSEWTGPSAIAVPIVSERRLPGGAWHGVLQLSASGNGDDMPFGLDGVSVNSGRGLAPGTYQWRIQQQYIKNPAVFGEVLYASPPVYLVTTIVDRTCVTGLTVTHSGGQTRVGGEVQDACGSWESFGPVRGTYKVYFHPRGTTKWRLLGTARTSSGGGVSFTHAGTLSGYFRVVFPAQGFYLASTSRSAYAHG